MKTKQTLTDRIAELDILIAEWEDRVARSENTLALLTLTSLKAQRATLIWAITPEQGEYI